MRPPAVTRGTHRAARLCTGALPCLALVLVLALAGCGGSSSVAEIDDPVASQAPLPLPSWYPKAFLAPAGATVVDVIDVPEPGQGRSVTWRSNESFESVEKKVDASLASLGWKPTEKTTDAAKGGVAAGTRRSTWFIENGTVYAIRLFQNDNLAGVRLSVELPVGG